MSNRVSRIDEHGQLANIEPTPSGGVRIGAFVTRTGIFTYELPDGSVRREYRPDTEVFNQDSLESLASAPLTEDHPPTLVNADNWKAYSKGHVSDYVTRDGQYISTRINVLDASTIEKVSQGLLKELSCGYTCDLDETPGETPQGEPYDAVQRRIFYNHVAVGPEGWGRAGSDVSLRLDSNLNQIPSHGDTDMTTKRTDAEAEPKSDEQELSTPAVEDAEKADEEKVSSEDTEKSDQELSPEEVEQLKAEVAELREKLEMISAKLSEEPAEEEESSEQPAEESNEDDSESKDDEESSEDAKEDEKTDSADEQTKLDSRVQELVQLREKARDILGPKATFDGKSPSEIRKEVISKVLPKVSLDGKSEDFLKGQFIAACELVNGSETSAVSYNTDSEQDEDPYKAYDSNLANAWKGNK